MNDRTDRNAAADARPHSSRLEAALRHPVLRVAAFYLGGSWGLVQFVQWIAERYGLAPDIPDIVLVVTFSLCCCSAGSMADNRRGHGVFDSLASR